ncbi:MAG: DUF177 domain-containing protein [Alphaproteobacteria bacterium]|nr:DUF177 domain-containing protein [Alphaproteobacteria bacterium]
MTGRHRQPAPREEFSRPVAVDRIPPAGEEKHIEANAAECLALARRYDVEQVLALSATLRLAPRRGRSVHLSGSARARLVQTCVISLDPIETEAMAEIETLYRPAPEPETGRPGRKDHTLDVGDIDPEAEDEEFYSGPAIDLGAAVAEAIALAIDPYPRRPGAVLPGPATLGEDTEAQAGQAAPTVTGEGAAKSAGKRAAGPPSARGRGTEVESPAGTEPQAGPASPFAKLAALRKTKG